MNLRGRTVKEKNAKGQVVDYLDGEIVRRRWKWRVFLNGKHLASTAYHDRAVRLAEFLGGEVRGR